METKIRRRVLLALTILWLPVLRSPPGADAAPAGASTATLARQMAGRWKLAPPGGAAGLRGVVTLRVVKETVAGTFTRTGGSPVPLRAMRLSFERLSFAFAPSSGAHPLRAELRSTLDADTWTGRLLPGHIPVDLTRQAP